MRSSVSVPSIVSMTGGVVDYDQCNCSSLSNWNTRGPLLLETLCRLTGPGGSFVIFPVFIWHKEVSDYASAFSVNQTTGEVYADDLLLFQFDPLTEGLAFTVGIIGTFYASSNSNKYYSIRDLSIGNASSQSVNTIFSGVGYEFNPLRNQLSASAANNRTLFFFGVFAK